MLHESENTRAVSVRELPDAPPGWSYPSFNKQQPSVVDIEAARDTLNSDTLASRLYRHLGDGEIIWIGVFLCSKGTMDLKYLYILYLGICFTVPNSGRCYLYRVYATCRGRCASYLGAIKPVTTPKLIRVLYPTPWYM